MRCNGRSASAGSRASAMAMRVIFHEILVQSRARIWEGGRRTVDVCYSARKVDVRSKPGESQHGEQLALGGDTAGEDALSKWRIQVERSFRRRI